jgi:hypothetical protein
MHPYFYSTSLGVVERDDIPFCPLEIGHDCWIGGRVVITPGCGRIGIGSVVGAGAVVTRDVPDFAICVGNPAKPVRFRFPEAVREWLIAGRWWELPIHELVPMLPALVAELGEEPWQHPLLCRLNKR